MTTTKTCKREEWKKWYKTIDQIKTPHTHSNLAHFFPFLLHWARFTNQSYVILFLFLSQFIHFSRVNIPAFHAFIRPIFLSKLNSLLPTKGFALWVSFDVHFLFNAIIWFVRFVISFNFLVCCPQFRVW